MNIHKHPTVAQAAVIGMVDGTWGEKVTAVVVLTEGIELSEEELQIFCRQQIAGYEVQ